MDNAVIYKKNHWKKGNPNTSSRLMVGLDGGFSWFKLGQRDGKFHIRFSWTTFWRVGRPSKKSSKFESN